MSAVNFFTPIIFARKERGIFLNQVRETVDACFYLGRKRVLVTTLDKDDHGIIGGLAIHRPATWMATLVKVSWYATTLFAMGFLALNPAVALSALALKVTCSALALIPAALLLFKASWRLHATFMSMTPQEFLFDSYGIKNRAEDLLVNLEKAVEVIVDEDLTTLVPSVQERDPQLALDEQMIEEEYRLESRPQVFQELATFIARTGFDHVSWNTIPSDNNRILLTDLSSMKSATDGIYGNSEYHGLLKCTSTQSEVEAIRAVTKQHAILPKNGQSLDELFNARLEEVCNDGELEEWYQQNELDAKTTIIPEISFYRQFQKSGASACWLIEVINRNIERAPKTQTIASSRRIFLDFRNDEKLQALAVAANNNLECMLTFLMNEHCIPTAPIIKTENGWFIYV